MHFFILCSPCFSLHLFSLLADYMHLSLHEATTHVGKCNLCLKVHIACCVATLRPRTATAASNLSQSAVSNMATRWGICSAGMISHDFTVALKTLPLEDHQVFLLANYCSQIYPVIKHKPSPYHSAWFPVAVLTAAQFLLIRSAFEISFLQHSIDAMLYICSLCL